MARRKGEVTAQVVVNSYVGWQTAGYVANYAAMVATDP